MPVNVAVRFNVLNVPQFPDLLAEALGRSAPRGASCTRAPGHAADECRAIVQRPSRCQLRA